MSRKRKTDKPFGDPDLQWGKPLYQRPKVPVTVKVTIEATGMGRGGEHNQETVEDKGGGLQNPQSVPQEQAGRLARLRDVPDLRVPMPVSEVTPEEELEQNVRNMFAEGIREHAQEQRQLSVLLKTEDSLPAEYRKFQKNVQSEAAWLRRVQRQYEQAEPTEMQIRMALDTHDVIGKALTPAEWALWKLWIVGFGANEVAQLLSGVELEEITPLIPLIHPAGLPDGWCALERRRRAADLGVDIEHLVATARGLDVRNEEGVQQVFNGCETKIQNAARCFVEFRYPAPSPEKLHAWRELQKLALSDAEIERGLTANEKIVIPVWIDCWWSGRETTHRLSGQFSEATVRRTVSGFIGRLEKMQAERNQAKRPRSKFIDSFIAHTLVDEPDVMAELMDGLSGGTSAAEIALALKSSPKDGEAWGPAFGGATIRKSYHHGQYTFERWGRTRWTDGGSTESNRGAFWDDHGEESPV